MRRLSGLMNLIANGLVAGALSVANAATIPAANSTGKVRLILPKAIDAVVGIETNIYFDNVILTHNPDRFVFNVTCIKGQQQEERWSFVPTAKDIGEYPLVLEVQEEDGTVLARGAPLVRVVRAEAGADKPITLLCIGDSLTHASGYTQHLLNLCKPAGNPRLTLIGTNHLKGTPVENRFEGYGGWTAERFTSYYHGFPRTGDHSVIGSPFLYPGPDGKPHLDFARYCRDNNAGKAPDFVTIFLGPNDVGNTPMAQLEPQIDRMLGHYDTLVKMIRSACPDTRIGVMVPVPPAASQDAFGANYGCNGILARWEYKRKQHRLVERMVQRYGDRERENIFILPAYVNLDCRHGYPKTNAPWNARTSLTAARLSNALHPGEGLLQIGDSIYGWMKAILAREGTMKK